MTCLTRPTPLLQPGRDEHDAFSGDRGRTVLPLDAPAQLHDIATSVEVVVTRMTSRLLKPWITLDNKSCQ